MSALLVPAMPAAPAPPPVVTMTPDEFVDWVGRRRAELIDGVVKEYPMPGYDHGHVCWQAARFIGNHVEDNNLGHIAINDTLFRTGPNTLRGGDVCFIRHGRLPEGPRAKGLIPVVPDLVLAVKSPTDTWIDLFAKVIEYIRAGVLVVVVLDPSKSTASIYRGDEQTVLRVGETLELPDVLPGFSVPVARFFA